MIIFKEKLPLKERFGFWTLLALSLSGTFGGSLFILIGKAIEISGVFIFLAFLLSGFISYLIGRVYAELATSIPTPGGGPFYIRTAFGSSPFLFLVYWFIFLAEISYASLNALGSAFYLSLAFPLPPLLIALFLVFLITIINLFGIEKTKNFQISMGAIVIISLFLLCIIFFKNFPLSLNSLKENFFLGTNFKNFIGLFWALPLTFLVFVGNEKITAISPQIKHKNKNIPLLLSLNIIILTIITLFISFIFLFSFPLSVLKTTPHPFSLFAQYFGKKMGFLALISALFACLSSLFFSFLVATQLAFALGKIGEFPKVFSQLNKNNVPFWAIIISGLLIAFFCLIENVEIIARLSTMGFFIQYLFLSFTLIELRKKRPHLPRPYLVKPFPLIPVLVIFFSLGFLLFGGLKAWAIVLLFSLIGEIIYFFSYFTKKRFFFALLGVITFFILFFIFFLIFYFAYNLIKI